MTPPPEIARDTWAPWAARWRATLLLILTITLLRLLYLAFLCPYTLVEDEAHYWEWSRRLALSYYTKGPGVAWTIAATTRLFGDTEFAVRLASPIASGIGALAVALLARETCRDRRAPFFAAALWFLVPIFQVMGLLLTIDGPYCACWALAMLFAARAFRTGAITPWAGLGLALGVGALYKYTILLALPGLLFALWWSRRHTTRKGEKPPPMLRGSSLAALLFLLCMLPIIVWNQREGWPTIAHLLGHLHVKGGDTPITQGQGSKYQGWHYEPKWTLDFLAAQLGMIGPALALGLLESLRAPRSRTPDFEPAGAILLIAGAVPILLFYLLLSFVASPEANWPMAGYITLLPLAAARIPRDMDHWLARLRAWHALPTPRPRQGFLLRRPESLSQVLWHATLVCGLITGLGMLRLDLLARLPGLNKAIPLHRFMWADVMAQDVQRLATDLQHETGQSPLIFAQAYGRASQFAFYLPGHPTTYCPGPRIAGRPTQYDYFPDTNLDLHPELVGRPAIMVGATLADWQKVFDRVDEIGQLKGEGKPNRPAFRGYNFRGFPPRTPQPAP
ncbi:MAG: phospholipid carrier-dependent glycosyltransferase [Tepidisphaera sp.]|nr:phospholipid carrier-dependent glycosyltransferase [Tepidisphaera sp.]